MSSPSDSSPRPVYIDLGSIDGAKLQLLLQSSNGKVGFLLASSENESKSVARTLPPGKEIRNYSGDPSTTLRRAIDEAANIVQRGEADYIAVIARSALFVALVTRQTGAYEFCEDIDDAFGRHHFYKYFNVPVQLSTPEGAAPVSDIDEALLWRYLDPGGTPSAALKPCGQQDAQKSRRRHSFLCLDIPSAMFAGILIIAIALMMALFFLPKPDSRSVPPLAAASKTEELKSTNAPADLSPDDTVDARPSLKGPGCAAGEKLEVPSGTPTLDSLTPILRWYTLAHSEGYSVYVAEVDPRTAALVRKVVDGDSEPHLSSTEYMVPAGRLVPGRTYRWNCIGWINGRETRSALPPLYFRTPATRPVSP
jgi:hypothetical protein